jgi:ergothioneine biosynthesis protein EgtB
MAAVQSAIPAVQSSRAFDPVARYQRIRSTTTALCAPLATEDYVVQSMPDASPVRWHLAHTTWFFEEFVLKAFTPGYRAFHPRYAYLFNSYYQSVGSMHERPRRGLLTRPTVSEIREYREHVDGEMQRLLAQRGDDERLESLTTLGLNHEQQHQELLLTDVKHLFSCNPLQPAYRTREASHNLWSGPLQFIALDGGVREIGASGKHFCFDNETPRHRVLVEPFALADRLVTNGEYLEFVREGGYRRHELWLADGWTLINSESWLRPLYWSNSLDSEFTLNGVQELDLSAPVSHLSYYEADAFARWTGARLPSEAEWELAAVTTPIAGNLLDSGVLHPIGATDAAGFKQLFGDVWEWTSSPYGAYPGYRPPAGALGEYNGKFMCSQVVLRGGSCATPADHIRPTYRNFFYPHARWQFSGVRLARDL